jgi:hypothetical protein
MRFLKAVLLISFAGLSCACSHTGNILLPTGIGCKNAAACNCLSTEKNISPNAVYFGNSHAETAPSALMLVEPDMNRLTW